MSRSMSKTNMSKTNMSKTNIRPPYCKVCHDAGKLESVYNSHFPKDERSNVICPTLLSLECRHCYKIGHTIKYCPSNKSADRYEKKLISRENYKNSSIKEKKHKKAVNENKYAYLCLDSDDEGSKKKEDFPKISVTISKKVDKSNVLSYANVIVKTQEQLVEREKAHNMKIYEAKLDAEKRRKESIEREKARQSVIGSTTNIVLKPPLKAPLKKSRASNISWADASSSDEDSLDDYINNRNNLYSAEDDDW
jgi:hypothetical protein